MSKSERAKGRGGPGSSAVFSTPRSPGGVAEHAVFACRSIFRFAAGEHGSSAAADSSSIRVVLQTAVTSDSRSEGASRIRTERPASDHQVLHPIP
jgi:hypothetical protein